MIGFCDSTRVLKKRVFLVEIPKHLFAGMCLGYLFVASELFYVISLYYSCFCTFLTTVVKFVTTLGT